MKKLALVFTSFIFVAGCSQDELIPAFPEQSTRVKLEPIQREIDGQTYTIRRNQDTWRDGTVKIRWAVVDRGKVISCSQPTVASCRDALQKSEREDQSGMY